MPGTSDFILTSLHICRINEFEALTDSGSFKRLFARASHSCTAPWTCKVWSTGYITDWFRSTQDSHVHSSWFPYWMNHNDLCLEPNAIL